MLTQAPDALRDRVRLDPARSRTLRWQRRAGGRPRQRHRPDGGLADHHAYALEEGGPTFDMLCPQVYPAVKAVSQVQHAGNSSGVVDGAAAMLLASPDYARAHGLTPRAEVVVGAMVSWPASQVVARRLDARDNQASWTTSANSARLSSPSRLARTSTER